MRNDQLETLREHKKTEQLPLPEDRYLRWGLLINPVIIVINSLVLISQVGYLMTSISCNFAGCYNIFIKWEKRKCV